MPSTLFVVLLGMGTVFAGLILIIFLCKVMSFFIALTEKNEVPSQNAAIQAAPSQAPATIPNKQSVIAAISAVVAEELGTDISNIRIHSIKRI